MIIVLFLTVPIIFKMKIACERVAAWTSGILDLSRLGLTELPVLPATLTRLYCNNNKLTRLPDLPADLTTLYCHRNKLTRLPTFPATLTYLYCHNNNLPVYPNEGESVHDYEKRLHHAEELQSRHRSVVRCRAIMEDLMMVTWNPKRIQLLIMCYGWYSSPHWNYDLKKYTSLTWNTFNEIL